MYQTFGRHTPIQRCRVHKARNILERLPKPLHAAVRAVLRQAWGLDDADKAERLIRNLARRLEQQAPGVAASILEGLDEILTVICLGLPGDPRRSLACTNNGSGAALFWVIIYLTQSAGGRSNAPKVAQSILASARDRIP